jgi:DNA-binding phage protein
MALTREFKETVRERALRDPKFRRALLQEAIESFISGDIDTGKLILRDYVNATVGFDELGARTKKNPKSLMRMLSRAGNPRADNLFGLIRYLQKREGVQFEIKPVN